MFAFLTVLNFACDLNTGIENCKEEYVKSKSQLDSMATNFLNQKTLLAVLRKDYKQVPFGKFINFIKPIKIEYIIIGKTLTNNTFTFEVEGDESAFILNKPETIQYGKRDLKTFLDSQGISYELFRSSTKFLSTKEYYSISSSPTDNAFLIDIGKLDGLLYSTKKGIEVNNPRYEEIIPISNNWYYFRKEF